MFRPDPDPTIFCKPDSEPSSFKKQDLTITLGSEILDTMEIFWHPLLSQGVKNGTPGTPCATCTTRNRAPWSKLSLFDPSHRGTKMYTPHAEIHIFPAIWFRSNICAVLWTPAAAPPPGLRDPDPQRQQQPQLHRTCRGHPGRQSYLCNTVSATDHWSKFKFVANGYLVMWLRGCESLVSTVTGSGSDPREEIIVYESDLLELWCDLWSLYSEILKFCLYYGREVRWLQIADFITGINLVQNQNNRFESIFDVRLN